MVISNITLVKTGAILGMATVTMGFMARNKYAQRIIESEYYKESINTLKNHKGALYILGAPIQVGKINIDDTENNYATDLKAKFEVPIKGSKEAGKLFFWAARSTTVDKWTVSRIELGLDKEPNRHLLIKSDQF